MAVLNAELKSKHSTHTQELGEEDGEQKKCCPQWTRLTCMQTETGNGRGKDGINVLHDQLHEALHDGGSECYGPTEEVG